MRDRSKKGKMEGARKTGQEKRVEIYWEKKNK